VNVLLLVALVADREAASVTLRHSEIDPLEDQAPVEPVALEVPEFRWSEVESDDLHTYQRNLRRLGCPEHLVRAVLEERVWTEYLPRIRRLTFESEAESYWDSIARWFFEHDHNPPVPEGDPVAIARLDAVREEFYSIQEQFGLRGEDGWQDRFGVPAMLDFRVSFLPETKQAPVLALLQEQDEFERSLRDSGVPDDEAQGQLAALEATHQIELRRLMTPDELEEYKLRSSSHAGILHWVCGFEYTTSEGAAIVRWAESLGNAFQPNMPAEIWEEGLRPILGDARFSEFARGRDSEYHDLVEMTLHYGLPETVAKEVYAVQQTLEQRVTEVRQQVDLPRQLREETLVALRAEAERAIHAQVGDTAYPAYIRNADRLRELVDGRPLEEDRIEADLF